jgi:hypothetical protein
MGDRARTFPRSLENGHSCNSLTSSLMIEVQMEGIRNILDGPDGYLRPKNAGILIIFNRHSKINFIHVDDDIIAYFNIENIWENEPYRTPRISLQQDWKNAVRRLSSTSQSFHVRSFHLGILRAPTCSEVF